MCCFSRPVKHVSATHIFARLLSDGRQLLAYSMSLEIDDELAMVLPLPVVPGGPEDAVNFIDLSGYPKLFVDMRSAFPEILSYPKRGGILRAAPVARPKLEVHEVGAFVASFVPTPHDFDRLDERFRLSPKVFEAREEYGDYGFAVFQLAPSKGWFGKIKRQTIHPMAFSFPSRRPTALFYPTLHVHDNTVPAQARFDHSLYCQTTDALLYRTMGFEKTEKPLGESVDAARARGLIDPELVAYRSVLQFEYPNQDQWLEAPKCAGPHVLDGKGELFTFQLCATAAYYSVFSTAVAHRWHEATRKLDAVHDAMRVGLAELTLNKREEWSLVSPDSEGLAETWLSNDDVYGSGDLGPTKLEGGLPRRIRLKLSTWMDEMEPQQFSLGFAKVPPPATVKAIREAVNELVRRALAS